jgi:rubrerythrin
MEQMNQTEADLAAELNDLLKLDHDAIQAYTLAIRLVRREEYKRQLEAFRADHQRHVDELSELIRSRDATPLELPHLPSGAFKLAVQAVGGLGGDRAVLLAFKANERQVRDKYRRSARAVHPADVTSVLARATDDESRHYAWALEALEDLGVSAESGTGRAEQAFEVAHARMADAVEGAERQALKVAQGATRTLREGIIDNPIGSALVAVGVGFIAASLLGGARSAFDALSRTRRAG